MILLVVTIMAICVGIIIGRKFLLLKDWYIWAYLLTSTYMYDGWDCRKVNLLYCVGALRFPLSIRLVPRKVWVRLENMARKECMDKQNALKNYHRIIQGIEQYETDYAILIRLVDDFAKNKGNAT